VRSLRAAVGANPQYALGWFNLGVQLSRMGPAHLLEAQGALARAAQLDKGFRDLDRQLTFDTDPYFSGLDVSRPLPPVWHFAAFSSRAPIGIAAVALLLVLLRLLWSVGLDQAVGKINERLLGWTSDRPWLARVNRPAVPLVAVLVTGALALYPMLTSSTWDITEVALLMLGVLIMVGIYVRSRLALAAPGEVRHFTWLPAVGLGAVLAVSGLGFAPVPPAQVSGTRRALRWIGPVALGLTCAGLLLIGWWTRVPATRALGSAALVMVASVLLPVKPLDGAYLTHKLVNAIVAFSVLAASILLLLGVL
jgi:hypothetical protein